MVFDSIMGYEEYSNLDFDASEKVEATTEKICRNNVEELKSFCEEKLFSETDKISLIYYSLSECENYSFWNDFLTKEFIRVFEIAINQNKMEKLYPLLENITVDETNSVFCGNTCTGDCAWQAPWDLSRSKESPGFQVVPLLGDKTFCPFAMLRRTR